MNVLHILYNLSESRLLYYRSVQRV